MTFAIAYPNIDPTALDIGPVVIRWYSLAYIAGLLDGCWYMRDLARQVSKAQPGLPKSDGRPPRTYRGYGTIECQDAFPG